MTWRASFFLIGQGGQPMVGGGGNVFVGARGIQNLM